MTPSRPAPLHLVLTGTFDVRNYGDLLFPLIAAHRLEPFGVCVHPASPTGRDTGWRDAIRPQPLRDALSSPATDGVLIGGGNIIHARPVTLPDYVKEGVADEAYGDLWRGATLAAVRRHVPVLWNAPGVPHAFDTAERDDLQAALAATDYLTVRDRESAAFLAPAAATVVPDTAFGLASLWPKRALEPAFRQLLARTGADPTARFAAIHIKARSVDGPPESLAPLIDAFARNTGSTPILMALGHCHDDHIATGRLGAALTVPHLDLSHPLGLREMAAAIAYSRAYVGASMHGYITAAVYGVPGMIVGRPKLPKMQGVLAHLERPQDEARDWRGALDRMSGRIGGPGPPIPRAVHAALDAHWHEVVSRLREHARRSRT